MQMQPNGNNKVTKRERRRGIKKRTCIPFQVPTRSRLDLGPPGIQIEAVTTGRQVEMRLGAWRKGKSSSRWQASVASGGGWRATTGGAVRCAALRAELMRAGGNRRSGRGGAAAGSWFSYLTLSLSALPPALYSLS